MVNVNLFQIFLSLKNNLFQIFEIHFQGYSKSDLWYAVLDFGTNYCNLNNLITGAGLDQLDNFVEDTRDKICTQYSSRNCDIY